VREVIDMRWPPPDIPAIAIEWGDSLGRWPVITGDVDGDGFDDFLVEQKDPQSAPSPYTILVYGGPEPIGSVHVSALRQTRFLHGEYPSGIYPYCYDNYQFARAGDIDTDGYDDFLLASCRTPWQEARDAGLVLLIFGAPDLPVEVDLGDLAGSGVRTIRLLGTAEDQWAGMMVASAGDLTGDGEPEIAIAANGPGSEDGLRLAGRVYVVDGSLDFSNDIVLAEVGKIVPGTVLTGAFGNDPARRIQEDRLGYTIASGGDLNGDGYGDLLVGAPWATRGEREIGAVYVVNGGEDLPENLLAAHPEEFGVEFLGSMRRGALGTALSGAGDVDGDGLDDFIVGAPGHNNTAFRGDAFLVYGARDWPSRVEMNDPGLRSFHFTSSSEPDINGEYLGLNVQGLGDWNLDGAPDFLVGAPFQKHNFGTFTGAAYVIYGSEDLPSEAFNRDVGTASLPGVAIFGARSLHQFGRQGDARGDLNGDGAADFLVVAPYLDPAVRLPDEPSTIYVFYGGARGSELGLVSVEPDRGPAGSRVTIRGSGFRGDEEVRFGGVPGIDTLAISSAEITTVVPPRETPGAVDVQVSGAGGPAILPGAFVYMPPSPYPDLVLDAAVLREKGYRTLEFNDLTGSFIFEARQFASPWFHDMNGDSHDDLIIGAQLERDASSDAGGRVFIIFGADDLPEDIGLEETYLYGTVIEPEPAHIQFGITLTFPGDVDGDGLEDLALGGALEYPIGDIFSPAGNSYLLFGRTEWEPRIAMASELAEGRAVRVRNEGCGHAWVAAPGDISGQGYTSLLFGNTQCGGTESTVRIYPGRFGPGDPFPAALTTITGDPQPVTSPIGGAVVPRSFGSALSECGDLNGDSIPDWLAGANHFIGECFLVLGGPPVAASVSIVDLIAMGRAVRVRREYMLSDFGQDVSGAGDFNGDGYADAILGSGGDGRDFEGRVYVILGSPELGATIRDIDLRQDHPLVIQLEGEYPYDFSADAEGIGDWNGDGYADIGITGACLLNKAARAYVVFGEPDPPRFRNLGSPGLNGFRIFGAEGNWFSGGRQSMATGDLDADGFKDIAIGESTPQGQRVLVVFGRPAPGVFVRGRVNGDATIDLSDAVSILGYLFLGGVAPLCLDAADVNDSGILDLSDAVHLLNHLFSGGPAPPSPYPEAGQDSTPDGLDCGA
jgi:hypothetical protein